MIELSNSFMKTSTRQNKPDEMAELEHAHSAGQSGIDKGRVASPGAVPRDGLT